MKNRQRTEAAAENADKQLIMLSLYTVMEIFVDELPEDPKGPARSRAIKDMASALKMRVEQLQEELRALEEADNETTH